MRKVTTGLLAVAVAVGGLSASAVWSNAEAEMQMLRFAEFAPNRGTRAGALQWLDSELRERSDGALGLDIVWGGALLGARDAAQGVSDGVADMASIVPVYAPGRLVVYEAVDTVQLPDEWVGMMAAYELMTTHPAAIEEANSFNLHYFGNYTTGPTQLLSRDKPITSLEDLDGLTLRATGAFVPALEAHGASTVSVSQPKVYEALSNGSIDGSTTYYYVVKAYKQHEIANYITGVDLGQTLAFGIAMNLETYQDLSAEHQALIDELGRDFTLHVAELMHASRTETKAELAAGIDGHAIEMIEPAAGMREALVELAEQDAQRWIDKAGEKDLDADGIRGAFLELIAKYDAEHEAQGYPWDR
ncbi:TRAP transporter substrate-binding protein DctP [Algihabitans albus]|uniref:TRAP transporter substrate-binding protein DctP n=1 Tax=Algihabitans albus TaxID=2164067 RepID=UPI000E5D4F46|nr:TRAP transporter substrate-binding protein DctP [Algihabitans albus]